MWLRKARGLGLVVAVLAAGAGCGGDDDSGENPSDRLLDQLSFPSALIFGSVPIKLEVIEAIQIQNEGLVEAVITEIRTEGSFDTPDYAFDIKSPLPLEIGRGSPTPLQFSFRAEVPVSFATTQVTLVFSNGEEATVGLRAETDDALRVSASTLDFGEVLAGRPAELTLSVTNLLDRPVPIFAQTTGGRARPDVVRGIGRFEIDAAVNEDGRLSNAAPLAARGSVDIVVRYVPDPSAVEGDEATWRIGACPELEADCSQQITMLGQPIPSPIACREAGSSERVTSIDFGNLNPPETESLTLECEVEAPVRLVNIGSPLSGTGIRVETSLIDPPPVQLDVGELVTLDVTFDPSRLPAGMDVPEATELTLELRDPVNDGPFETIEIPIQGGHGRPELEITPLPVDFQSAAVGTRRPERVQVRNTAPIAFSGQLRVVDDPGVEAGTFTSDRAGGTVDLEPGESGTFDVDFVPSLPEGIKTGALIFETTEESDPRNPDFQIEVPLTGRSEDLPACEVFVSTESVELGRSVALTENRAFVAITNVDSDLCLVNGIRLGPGSDPELRLVDPPTELRIPRDESRIIEVAYVSNRPVDSEDLVATGTLEMYVSSSPSFYELPISAEQSRVAFMRAPNIVDLRAGDSTCAAYRQTVSLLNADVLDLSVQSIELTGDDAFAFDLELPQEPPFVIAARRGRSTFDVVLTPSLADGALLSAQIEVTLADTNQPFVIPVLAQAEDGSRFSERFVQGDFSEVDVVFVLPAHPNDFGENVQAVLAEAASTWTDFIDPIRDAGMDYHIGFITGVAGGTCGATIRSRPQSPEHDGECGLLANGAVGVEYRDEWRVIDGSETAPPESFVFQEQIQKAPPSFFSDTLFEAAHLALHPEPVRDWNAEIHRPDALLHFVFLNNRDDDSIGSIDFYVESLRNARGYVRRFDTTASAIAGPEDDTCSNPTIGLAQATPRIIDFLNRLGGGTVKSVCNPDWAAQMGEVGREATGIRKQVQLARPANASSVRVFVDGVELPELNGPEINWSYDSARRVIRFRDPRALDRGAEIEVTYRPVCSAS